MGYQFYPTPDRHAAINARRGANAILAGEAQDIRRKAHEDRNGQSVRNIDPRAPLGPRMEPTWGGTATTPGNPTGAPLVGPRTPAAQPAPVVNTPSGESREQMIARIDATYGHGGTQDITPPTPVLQPGNPNALKPGQYWERPGVDPRGGSPVPAPGGIQERVGSLPGKGGGNILSIYRPNEYKGPGESPTGIVHNDAPKFHENRGAQAAMIAANPDLPIHIANSPANLAFVEAYRKTGDAQKALAAAREAHQIASAAPVPPPPEKSAISEPLPPPDEPTPA